VDALLSSPRKRGSGNATAGRDSRFRGNDMREHVLHSLGGSQDAEKGAAAGTAAPAGGSTTTDYCPAFGVPSAWMTSVPSLRV
jgi:hypothetical protein